MKKRKGRKKGVGRSMLPCFTAAAVTCKLVRDREKSDRDCVAQ